jgi:hypothetical protein
VCRFDFQLAARLLFRRRFTQPSAAIPDPITARLAGSGAAVLWPVTEIVPPGSVPV